MKGKNYTLIGPHGYWPGPDLYKWMADQDFQWFTMLDVEELGIDSIAKEAADRANDNVDQYILVGTLIHLTPHMRQEQEYRNQTD